MIDPGGPTNERQALVFALLSVALWSTVATAFKLGLESLAPVQLLFLGATFSAIFFCAALFQSGQIVALLATPYRELLRHAALGVLNPFAYYVILFEAYDRLPAQIAQPLNYTWAVALAILAWPILGQRPTRKALMGMGVSYIGVVVLLSQGRLEGFRELDVFGILLMLASTLIWAIYWLLSVRSRAPALVVMTPGFVIGCICVTVVCGLTSGFPELNTANLALGAWVGLFEMGVTFLLWRTALARSSNAGRLGQLIFLAPFVSLVLIHHILGEAVHWTSVVGLVGIVMGLMISQRSVSP